jgi:hypothetical protein
MVKKKLDPVKYYITNLPTTSMDELLANMINFYGLNDTLRVFYELSYPFYSKWIGDVTTLNKKNLEEGMKHEFEHVDKHAKYGKLMAKKIAADHLLEDPEYYKKLKEIELGGTKKIKKK